MKKLGIIISCVTIILFLSISKKEVQTTVLNGPSSVSALNSHFDSQEHLNNVFLKWLTQFDFEPNSCEEIITDLESINYPNLFHEEVINVRFVVFNKCEKKHYTHQASFEFVVLNKIPMT